ncbi:MAG: glycosyltransferase [Acidimicrobiia bacterium]|nr:glycosyltransferase [Acidimicrobiia bacterium]
MVGPFEEFRLNACTIVARNYLAHARVLARSFMQHHPDGTFWTLVLDPDDELRNRWEPFVLIEPDDIGIAPDELRVMRTIYDVMELATAVKPWLLERLLQEGDAISYIDPDIQVFAPLEELDDYARESGIVLTPHCVRPMPRDGLQPDETDIMFSGIYNLGYCTVGQKGLDMLRFWQERLARECIVDLPRARFVDQRWMDWVPGIWPTHIVHDPQYNVAYWNADSRKVDWHLDSYTVDGEPLKFFHFSGYSPDKPATYSKHSGTRPRVLFEDSPSIARLCHEYGQLLLENGYDTVKKHAYPYNTAAAGLTIDRPARRAYLAAATHRDDGGLGLADPWDQHNPEAFVSFLNETEPGAPVPELTRYLASLYRTRADIEAHIPYGLGGGVSDFLRWVTVDGPEGAGVPPVLMPALSPSSVPTYPTEALKPGVNFTGYVLAESGTGEHARLLIKALKTTDVPYSVLPYRKILSRQQVPLSDRGHKEPIFDINLISVNADQTPTFFDDVPPGLTKDHYNIGFWAWEVNEFPDEMAHAADLLDEVWANSTFSARAIADKVNVPVFALPLPIEAPQAPAYTREQVGFGDEFTVLFCFDYYSVFERKNPIGLVNAFVSAFPESSENAKLVIKTINSDVDPANHALLVEACAGRSDIEIRDGYVEHAFQQALIAHCDCYVSLHRAEGFGLTLAEAMARAVPVIATGYSGNLDFMDDANSLLVPYTLAPVPFGAGPYPITADWAEPDSAVAGALIRRVFDDPVRAKERAVSARSQILAEHGIPARAAFMSRRLREIRSTMNTTPGALQPQAAPQAAKTAGELVAEAGALISRGPGGEGAVRFGQVGTVMKSVSGRTILHERHHQNDVDMMLAQAVLANERQVAEVKGEISRLEDRIEHLTDWIRTLHARLDDAAGRTDLPTRLDEIERSAAMQQQWLRSTEQDLGAAVRQVRDRVDSISDQQLKILSDLVKDSD